MWERFAGDFRYSRFRCMRACLAEQRGMAPDFTGAASSAASTSPSAGRCAQAGSGGALLLSGMLFSSGCTSRRTNCRRDAAFENLAPASSASATTTSAQLASSHDRMQDGSFRGGRCDQQI